MAVIRFGVLIAGILLYGLLGSPTPDRPGLPEVLVGLCLLAAVGAEGISCAFAFGTEGRPFWHGAGRALLWYGLSAPLVMAGLAGHGTEAIIRDLAPFLFLMLPVFLWPLFLRRPALFPFVTAAVIVAALAFALRALLGFYPFNLMAVASFYETEELLYLANAPCVLFAALILPGLCIRRFMTAQRPHDFVAAALFLCAAFLPFLAMAAALQRASLGLWALYSLAVVCWALQRSPKRAALPLLVLGLAASLLWPVFAVVSEALTMKNSAVGLNMRAQEARAVWEAVSISPLTFLFGIGWGGAFHSPAVGNLSVNFTHSLVTAMLLKAGFAGLCLLGAYMAGLFRRLLEAGHRDFPLALALAFPLLIDLFLYASYKSLDFGLILCLVPLSLLYLRTKSAG